MNKKYVKFVDVMKKIVSYGDRARTIDELWEIVAPGWNKAHRNNTVSRWKKKGFEIVPTGYTVYYNGKPLVEEK